MGGEILIEEGDAYLAAGEGGARRVPDLPAVVPYREFIAHTLALAESGATQAYFASRLGDVDEPTVPFGIYDTHINSARINEFDYRFDEAFCRRLRELCSRLEISPSSVFHLAWGLVIGRCSGRDDVMFGTVLSGRLQGTQGAARGVGLFLNTLPIRVSLSGDVADALRQTHSELLNLMEHEHGSLTLVRECTALSSDAPLFTSLLNYRRNPSGDAELVQQSESDGADENEEIIGIVAHERSNYPLSLNVNDVDGEQYSVNQQVIDQINGDRLVSYVRAGMEMLMTSILGDAESVSTQSLQKILY